MTDFGKDAQAFQPEAVAGRRPYVAAAAAEHEKDLVAVAAAASMEEPEKEAELEEDAVVAAPGAMLFPEEIEDLEVPELEEEIPGPEEDLAVVEPGAHRFPVRIVVRLFVFWVFLDVM